MTYVYISWNKECVDETGYKSGWRSCRATICYPKCDTLSEDYIYCAIPYCSTGHDEDGCVVTIEPKSCN